MPAQAILPPVKILEERIYAKGNFPNNPSLPVLLYKGVLQIDNEEEAPEIIISVFEDNNWSNSWTDGIFNYHHYHSITHEVLGVSRGSCSVMLGGENGTICKISQGDVLILPAGVAHCNIESSPDFQCVGAYPHGSDYDIKKGKPEEKAAAAEAIQQVNLPGKDPIYGANGPLMGYWKK